MKALNPVLCTWCAVLTICAHVSAWIAVKAHYRIRDLEETVRELSHKIKP